MSHTHDWWTRVSNGEPLTDLDMLEWVRAEIEQMPDGGLRRWCREMGGISSGQVSLWLNGKTLSCPPAVYEALGLERRVLYVPAPTAVAAEKHTPTPNTGD